MSLQLICPATVIDQADSRKCVEKTYLYSRYVPLMVGKRTAPQDAANSNNLPSEMSRLLVAWSDASGICCAQTEK